MTVDIAAIVRDATWVPHRYDPDHDAFHFVHVPRAGREGATFLTDEYLPKGLETVVIARADAVAAAPPPQPIHIIAHSAFCCSTLLARAFEGVPAYTVLKEPMVLNDIVGWRHRGGGPPARVAQVLDQTMALLARPLGKARATIVKPSNLANGLLRAIVAMRRDTQLLLLHAPLSIYLRSIVKKQMDGRLWVRDLLIKLMKEGLIDFGFSTEDLLGQTDLQVAAIGWLAQHALFQSLAGASPDRVHTLDSETLLASPLLAVDALGRHFGGTLTEEALAAIVAGPAFTRHSKDGSAYGGQTRLNDYDRAASSHADELAKVHFWADKVADNAGIGMQLPSPLLPRT